jgi:hypothetical protein
MDTLQHLGREIYEVKSATYQTYGNILNQEPNASLINQAQPETFSYGNDERQKLDLYTPSASAPKPTAGKSCPVLIFVYGGSFVEGDRIIAEIPGGLVYRNIGFFFAEKLGFETLVLDYRLLSHGANFRNGGEDIDEAMEWIAKHYGKDENQERDVFLMGTSAGTVHITTWLFGEWFAKSREAFIAGKHRVKLAGVIVLGCPFNWDARSGPLTDLLISLYGSKEAIKENEPIALMRRANQASDTQTNIKWPRFLVLVSELDPEALIVAPSREFAAEWHSRGGDQLLFKVLKGHNHISPPLALGSQIEREESWGYELGRWIAGEDVKFM